MSAIEPGKLRTLAMDAAVRLCWTQWVAMGAPASSVGSASPRSIIDLEALLLTSLYLSGEERRLQDLVAWWAKVGVGLTSVQRFLALVDRFPEEAGKKGLGEFAHMAVAAGDRRWLRHVGGFALDASRKVKGRNEPNLIEACTLWPRLRAAFGVGAKADALAFLLGLRGGRASVQVIAFATGYSSVSIRKAASEMALARLIREAKGRPAEYHAPPGPWAELLELFPPGEGRNAEPVAPPWRFWSEIFAFLVGVMEWAGLADSQTASNEHVLASKARDLMEKHQRALNFNSIPTPPPDAFPGRRAPIGLSETTRVVVEWAEKMV